MARNIVFVSSSIANWEDKIMKKYQARKYNPETDKKERVIFFGLYSFNDYKRVWQHGGEAIVVWCGTDILYLKQWKNWWRRLLRFKKAKHICENAVQYILLYKYGFESDIRYNFYGNVKDFPISFKPSRNPHVFLNCPEGREEEYGLKYIQMVAPELPEITFHIYGKKRGREDNIIYHGVVPEKQFNEEIRNYHAGIRLNHSDGFSEILSKSVLLGQYPISFIDYPDGISRVETLGNLLFCLRELKNKTKPNPARDWWAEILNPYETL